MSISKTKDSVFCSPNFYSLTVSQSVHLILKQVAPQRLREELGMVTQACNSSYSLFRSRQNWKFKASLGNLVRLSLRTKCKNGEKRAGNLA